MKPVAGKRSRLITLCLPYVCAGLAGILAALLTAALFAKPAAGGENAEQLAVYWSRYVSLALEGGAEPAALESMLRQDAAAYPGHDGFRLTVKDHGGSVIAVYSGNMERDVPLHKTEKPYLAAGMLSGTIEVEAKVPARPAIWPGAWAVGTAAALLTGGAALLQRRLSGGRLAAWADYAGSAARQGVNSTVGKGTVLDITRPPPLPLTPEEERLSAAIGGSAALINQLQTARRTMVAEVAHELRTPLAVVRAALDNALYENESIAPERLAVLSEQVTAMSSLIQDLQDLTLAESGSLRLEKTWFTPAATAHSLVELFKPDAEEKGIILVPQLDQEAKLFGDERRIRQLLLNLLGNAVRHARGRIDVSLTVSQTCLLIIIKDDGWGMEPEEVQDLFQRYYRKRTYANGSPAPRGVGLGLAVVRGIAEAHGGSVSVISRFGEGAVFTVQLPLFRE
ncbi:MAG: two-component system sensor histidine kinase [Paenibacillaceae bacterium]|jgi:signal transduction histidine kinase|nr:two-component system sensor histidine kinase [Paenibacillaceae bacterium]